MDDSWQTLWKGILWMLFNTIRLYASSLPCLLSHSLSHTHILSLSLVPSLVLSSHRIIWRREISMIQDRECALKATEKKNCIPKCKSFKWTLYLFFVCAADAAVFYSAFFVYLCIAPLYLCCCCCCCCYYYFPFYDFSFSHFPSRYHSHSFTSSFNLRDLCSLCCYSSA